MSGGLLAYLLITLVQVWWASRQDQARPAQAIIVLGSAQYNGVPSPDLKARLDHALSLWKRGLASIIVVTGGKEPGDLYTEASASADYLSGMGVPPSRILREDGGRDSWQSLSATADFLKARGEIRVILVSDPFHDERISLMADELGLTPYVSPTRTSPIRGLSVVPYFAKETIEVAIGRVFGFRRLVGVSRRVQRSSGKG
jgi:uncharacterized SAM-binding protein YcdF (DUF218 family)